ncbi:phosphoribosylamine--glycine ligase [Fusobacterium sp. PH5-44]|uniref:phosphoribosylamine--glycine ligase n=1 Tax=unclassified Fusobacterium TaxID=2648384 RepID=UPI003D1BE141
MKILVVGNGGREHCICWKLNANPKINKIYCAPGNGGISLLDKGKNVNINTLDEIVNFAKTEKIDLTIVGSETLLVNGIVDKFQENNLKIFGPNKKAAILEGSKVYSKNFMKKYGVKTAAYEVFNDEQKAKKYIETCDFPIVIKASGLAAGKGVIICENKTDAFNAINEIMVNKVFENAGEEIVIEEFLEGVEASILSFTDSKTILPFISAKDHKKIGENETGLNTGGMGTIAPNPYVTEEVFDEFVNSIMKPTLNGIIQEEMDFAGVIFFGLMITRKGVYLLEYNMRMGDPETQVVLPLLKSDFLQLIEDAMNKNLSNTIVEWSKKSACCIVLVSGGYPQSYKKDFEISGLNDIQSHFFIAGAINKNNTLFTNGGRVLNIVALGDNINIAREKAYNDVAKVNFNNIYYRKDIGKIK